jgi:hypothetical protein
VNLCCGINYVSSHNLYNSFEHSSVENFSSDACVMHPSGSPYLQGAGTAPSPVAPMAGQVDSFDGGQAGNFQLFLSTSGHSHGQPIELAMSESTGTNSSHSIFSNNLAFEKYKVLIFDSFIWFIHSSQIIRATSTPISSYKSGWSNIQTDSGFVPVEQYYSLQAQYNKIHREHTNLIKEHVYFAAKNSVLKYISHISYETLCATHSSL